MRTRSQKANKMDITSLPKEVLFNLLLMVEPHEIGTVCQSKNVRVRAICSSQLFQEAYKKKYPRKLMTGNISVSKDDNIYTFTDEKDNEIKISMANKNIALMEYTPFKQTYVKSSSEFANFILDEPTLRTQNRLSIYIKKFDGKYNFFINRETIYGVYTVEDDKRFQDSRGLEVQEFLEYIERPNWYSENFKKSFGVGDIKAMKEFNDEVIHSLKDLKIGRKSVWQVIKPLTF